MNPSWVAAVRLLHDPFVPMYATIQPSNSDSRQWHDTRSYFPRDPSLPANLSLAVLANEGQIISHSAVTDLYCLPFAHSLAVGLETPNARLGHASWL